MSNRQSRKSGKNRREQTPKKVVRNKSNPEWAQAVMEQGRRNNTRPGKRAGYDNPKHRGKWDA